MLKTRVETVRLSDMQIFTILTFLLFPILLSAKTLTYKPLSLQVEKGDRLEVSGFNGKVLVTVAEKAQGVTVQLKQINPEGGDVLDVDEWLFSMQKQERVVQVHVRSPQSKATWAKMLAQNNTQPRFELAIQMPSLPTEVSWREGDVTIQGLKNELKIYAHSGNVNVINHQARVQVNHQKGVIRLRAIKGDADVDTYSGKVVVDGLEGVLKLKNFNGASDILKVNGQVDFVTYDGKLKVSGGKGRVEYANEKGKISLDKFEGQVRGVSEQGSLSATLVGASNVRVTSKEGAVSLRMLNSSASINAGSKEGALNTPQYLRLTRLPNLRLVRGKLRGKNPGQVYVRTESGSIRIR